MRRLIGCLLSVPMALFVVGCGADAGLDPAVELVVYGGRVWDGTGGELSAPALLQIAGGRVISLGPVPDGVDVPAVAAEAGAEVVDATGRYLIPGLINVHGHVGGTWTEGLGVEYTDYVTSELERYARFGITTVNSLGGDQEPSFAIRDAGWGDGGLGRARLLVAGEVVTGATPAEAVAVTDRNAALGADWIKIRVDDNLGATTKMAPDAYEAVIARAHEHGLPLAAHLFYQDDAKRLLRAGADLVAHSVRDVEVDAELIGLFRESGVCYVPTLTREVSTFVYGDRPDFFDDEFLTTDVDSAQVVTVSDPVRQDRIRGSRAARAYQVALEIAQHNLKRLSESDVVIAFGTDSGPLGRFQGYFEHMEMDLMAQAGLSTERILRSATGAAAECLGRDDIGVLEVGRRADFVVLADDPLETVRNLRSITSVWIGGARVRGSEKVR